MSKSTKLYVHETEGPENDGVVFSLFSQALLFDCHRRPVGS
jgi:hypothetical protein